MKIMRRLVFILFFLSFIYHANCQDDFVAKPVVIDCDTIRRIPLEKYQLGLENIEIDSNIVEIRIWKHTYFLEHQYMWIIKFKDKEWTGLRVDYDVAYIDCGEKYQSISVLYDTLNEITESVDTQKVINDTLDTYPLQYLIIDKQICTLKIKDWESFIDRFKDLGLFNLKNDIDISENASPIDFLGPVDGDEYRIQISINNSIDEFSYANPDYYADRYIEYESILRIINILEKTKCK